MDQACQGMEEEMRLEVWVASKGSLKCLGGTGTPTPDFQGGEDVMGTELD